MRLSKPLYWHQGLFLQPQHLQYLDKNSMDLAYSTLQASRSYPWGFSSLHINRDALASGVFECESFSCVLKDGSFLSYPQNCQLQKRSFDSIWLDKTKPLVVYIGVVRESDHNANVTVVAAADSPTSINTRYTSNVNGDDLLDRHEGGQSTSVKMLSYNARIYFEPELSDCEDVEFLAVARLVQAGGEVNLDTNFIPPCMCLDASPALLNYLDTLKNNLLGRASMLKSYEGTIGADGGGNTQMAMRNRMALQVLAAYVPKLAAFLEQPFVEPVTIYGVLRELAGQLSIYSDNYSIMGESDTSDTVSLVTYDHANLTTVFDIAVRAIGSLLNELSVGPELLVNLSRSDDGKYSGSLSQEFFNHKNTVYLVLRSTTRLKDQQESFLSYSKLGASGQVEVYARRSLPGVSVIPIDGKPLGVTDQPNAYYYAVERQGYEWGYVEDTNQVSVVWDGAPDDLCIDLLVVRS